MSKLRKSVLASLGILPFLMPVDIGASEQAKSPTEDLLRSGEELPWKKARFSIDVQTGSRTIGTLDALIPFMGNDDFLVYTDIMAKIGTGAKNKNGNTWEGNLGLGLRRVNDKETAIYGVYAFFDYLKSVNDNYFSQITVGAERLGLTWDFRVNGYLPVGTKEYTKENYSKIVIDQHNLIEYYKSSTEVATTGADVEIGRTLGSQKLRGYLAAYSFGKDLTGPRLRLEYQLNDHFALNAAVQHDKDRGTQYFVGARFTVGGAKAKNSNSIYSRLTDPVVRDTDIVTQETVTDHSRIELNKFWVVDSDHDIGGDGTLENPYQYLDQAIEAAPEGAIIFVKGKESGIHQLLDRIALKQGQLLWGGNQALYWDFNNNRPAYTAGDNVSLLHAGEGVRQSLGGGVEMANNSAIYNFDIVADDKNFDNAGIYINNKQGVIVNNVDISNFHSSDNNQPYSGIYVTGADSSASFSHVNLNNNDIGMSIDGGQVAFQDITVTNSTSYGVKLANAGVTANNVTIDQSGVGGVYAENSHFTANNLTINHSLQGSGYYQQGGSANFTGDISVDNSAQSGIYFDNVDVIANNLTVKNSQAGYGYYQHGGSAIFAGNVNIDTSAQSGAYLDNVNFTANNVTVNNSVEFGIFQEGGVFTANGAVDVQNSGEDGFYANNATVTIKNNAILSGNGKNTQTGNHGSGLFATNSDINIATLIADKNFYDGVNLQDSHVISNAITTTDNQRNGVVINGNKNNQQNLIGTVTTHSNNLGNGLSITNSNVLASVVNATENLYGVTIDNGQLKIVDGGNISTNAVDGIVVNGAQSVLTMNGTTLKDNVGHGLQLNDGSNATIKDVTVTGNGMSQLPDVHNLDQFTSGIQITDGTLNATHITVEGNAGGIELIKGALTINENSANSGQTSKINNNSGYGVYTHGVAANDTNNRKLQINNTEINNTLSVENIADTGYGLYAKDADAINLQQITINTNAAGGIKAISDDRAINLTITGGEIRGNKAGAGIDVSGVSNYIKLMGVQIAHNTGAGINAVSKTISELTASNTQINDNTADGISLTAKDTVTINMVDNSIISNNGANGIAASSTHNNVDVTLNDSQVNGNKQDGIHLLTETETASPGNGITSHVALNNTEIKDNSVNGIYLKQNSTATALYNFTNTIITGNANGGLYITHGTLDGTLDAVSKKSITSMPNHIEYIKSRKGDFANIK